MSNFAFLAQIPEYQMFSAACIEAEQVLCTSAAMCAIGSRKALELAVKWVYTADLTMLALTNMCCVSAEDSTVLYVSKLPNATLADMTNSCGCNQKIGGVVRCRTARLRWCSRQN